MRRSYRRPRPGTVFTAGDNAYTNGTLAEYNTYYEPTWGRHKARTRPSPGNHEYNTAGAAGYFAYFGALAGPGNQGYYSYDLGNWHVVSLNSEVSMVAGSAQEAWLRSDLAASTKPCTFAVLAQTVVHLQPMDPAGALDTTNGIREFVAGMGGASHYGFAPIPAPNSEVRNATTYGVLKFMLHPTSYDWQFVPVAGRSFTDTDTGTTACH